LVVAIDLEILFQSLISSFQSVHHFRMISGSEVKLHVQSIPRTRRSGIQFCTAIRSDMGWDTMLGKDM